MPQPEHRLGLFLGSEHLAPLMSLDTIEQLVEKNGKATGSLIGIDGNAMNVMGYVSRQLRRAGWPSEDINQVTAHMMSGDYNNVIVTGVAVLEEDE
tara:strand:+ start:226 stop:513 length:288 start_codon:yes stop_codon:yes gene_type:complete